MDRPNEMITPCMGICTIDEGKGWCIGCGRTRQEIASWRRLTDQERLQLIKKELKDRLKLMGKWPMKGSRDTKDAD